MSFVFNNRHNQNDASIQITVAVLHQVCREAVIANVLKRGREIPLLSSESLGRINNVTGEVPDSTIFLQPKISLWEFLNPILLKGHKVKRKEEIVTCPTFRGQQKLIFSSLLESTSFQEIIFNLFLSVTLSNFSEAFL